MKEGSKAGSRDKVNWHSRGSRHQEHKEVVLGERPQTRSALPGEGIRPGGESDFQDSGRCHSLHTTWGTEVRPM